jgi:hypothetical protein
MHFTRRRFLAAAVGGVAAVGGAFAYARHVEPGWLRVSRISVPLKNRKLDLPLRIAHLADFHASDEVPFSIIDQAVDLTVRNHPDLICVTGDFITTGMPSPRIYRSILQKLSAAAPTFAVTGNHDGGTWSHPRGGFHSTREVKLLLEDSGIELLSNRSTSWVGEGSRVSLVGLADLWAEESEPDFAFGGIQETDDPVIVLSHNPDSKSALQKYPWDLMLCGHTHGGQLRLPIVGTPFAPVRDHRFVHGLGAWDERWIHVTSGVGNLHGIRLNCRPEVALLTLTSGGARDA